MFPRINTARVNWSIQVHPDILSDYSNYQLYTVRMHDLQNVKAMVEVKIDGLILRPIVVSMCTFSFPCNRSCVCVLFMVD